ncbi:hypothetical protein [Flyfo siphovirus Tbat1_6]|uniref:hypothetical protein n=1 Tax=Flyfo siphovirus Tbat1_6 TaxID=2907287 RepID=UPI00233F3D10|nr:hypothetical protein PRB80_gp12 [Flyfo siphovirus Tbat1_6]UIW10231.1 hypothetical protein [Flyfo siphovirus Tbat1_6]
MGQGTESCGGYDLEYDEYEENLCSGRWVQRDGSSIEVSKMGTNHIKNTLRMVRGLAASSSFTSEECKWEAWTDVFEEELVRRVDVPAKNKTARNPQPVRGAKVQMVCHCGKHYDAREADLKRGWGLSCSKSCAASRKVLRLPAAKRI